MSHVISWESSLLIISYKTIFLRFGGFMNQLLYIVWNPELTGKQHKNVMQAIRNMEPAWEKVNGGNFSLVEYRDAKGELRPCQRSYAVA